MASDFFSALIFFSRTNITPGEVSTKYDIFISLRYEEAEPPAVRLRDALRSKGLTVYLCNEPNSTDLGEAIAEALDHCSLVVIMGTPTYGKKTKAKFSTFQELNFIIEEEKPFFLIKMCDKFQVSTTKFRLSNSLAHYPWRPTDARGHPPADLVDQIVGHCHKVKTGKVTRSVAADRKQEPQDESVSEAEFFERVRKSDVKFY